MRRAIPSFTVEVRRRPRLATTSNSDAQSSETKPPQAAFDRESHRAAAAAFGSKQVDPSPTDVASSPRGRILPSLVADEPLRRQLQDAVLTTAESDPPSRTPKRPSVRTSKEKIKHRSCPGTPGTRASRLTRMRRCLRDRRPNLIEPPACSRVKGRALRPALRPRQLKLPEVRRCSQTRREKLPTSRDDFRAKPLPDDQASAMGTDSPATLPSRRDAQSPEGRKRTIMARYVFGNELKPGERWKRRLLTSRLKRRFHAALGGRSPIQRGESRCDPH